MSFYAQKPAIRILEKRSGNVAGRMRPNLKITFTEMLFADLQYRNYSLGV